MQKRDILYGKTKIRITKATSFQRQSKPENNQQQLSNTKSKEILIQNSISTKMSYRHEYSMKISFLL